MFCSTIIPTIGRPSLDRAVNSVLEQEFMADEFEVIVVNDSGRPLPVAAWQQSERVQIIHTNRRERSVARNTGAAMARGRYLHFLDDDDWLLPGALNHFASLSRQDANATWLYGGVTLVDLAGNTIAEVNVRRSGNCFAQAVAGAWFALQGSLINSEAFFAVGGFHPLLHATQDLDLARKLAYLGDFANLKENVAGVQRDTHSWQSSTKYDKAPAFNRWSRNEVLNEKGAFSRLQGSAYSAYWHGRIFHAYMTAVQFNLQRRQYTQALSRFAYGWLAVPYANYRIMRSDFWQACIDHRVPETSTRAIRNSQLVGDYSPPVGD